MPVIRVVRTRPNADVEYYNINTDAYQRVLSRHSFDTSRVQYTDFFSIIEYNFATRDELNAYLNDSDRIAGRDEFNAYNDQHGITLRLIVLDGENSGRVKFNSTTNLYDVISMSETEADAWVTELVSTP